METSNKLNRKDFLVKLVQVGSYSLLGTAFIVNTACEESGFNNSGLYAVDSGHCIGCGDCISRCNFNAITISNKLASISSTKCIGCGKCVSACDYNAISHA